MDPLSITLASTTFISFAKDLMDLGKDLHTFCTTVRKAPAILNAMVCETKLLGSLLERLSDEELLTASDTLASDAVHNLRTQIEELKTPVEKLKRKREKHKISSHFSVALKHEELKEHLQDIERAKSTAMIALQLLTHSAMQRRLDTISLQLASPDRLHSQVAFAVQQTLLSVRSQDSDPVLDQSEPVVTQLKRRTKSVQRRSELKLKPWLLSQIWTISVGQTSGLCSLSFRTERVITRDAAIVLAIEQDDFLQVRRLFASGQAHPSDVIDMTSHAETSCSLHLGGWPFYIDRVTLLEFALKKSTQPTDMCKLLLSNSDLASDLKLMRWVVREAEVVSDDVYKDLVQISDVDLSLDWADWYHYLLEWVPWNPPLPGSEELLPDFKFVMPYFTDNVQWIAERQKLVNNVHIHPSLKLTENSPLHVIDNEQLLSRLLVIHGLDWSYEALYAEHQAVKDWLLHALLTQVYTAKMLDSWHARLGLLLGIGACPTAFVQGCTAVEILLATWYHQPHRLFQTSATHLFKDWLCTLAMHGIETVPYLEDVNTAGEDDTLDSLSFGVEGCPDYCISVHRYEYSLATESLQCRVLLYWKPYLWYIPRVPGHWAEHDHQLTSAIGPDYSVELHLKGWKRSEQPCLELQIELDEPGLRSHLGFISDNAQILTQDDHSYIARSFSRRVQHHVEVRRRASSQPRSIEDFAWMFPPDEGRPWLSRAHRCPFDTQQRLHWLKGEHRDGSFQLTFARCLESRLRYSASPGQTCFDHWHEEHQRLRHWRLSTD
ncbi:hypothetical protein AMS68_003822 [Peltaster fructicola]|uniref:Fungal N-terminal domain-containing protein n=1 Tax=Peltaster fructicola TaxID=286661 RepID=A0A6H0XUH4_9PEZI|nr:hypothetical protein AMS68_003822 [Peltaster fructicola]